MTPEVAKIIRTLAFEEILAVEMRTGSRSCVRRK
jgi:hypothetical protein